LRRLNQKEAIRVWLVILALTGLVVFYFVGTPEYRRFINECSEAGVDRMVQPPSDDDLHRLYMDCRDGRWRRR
jgi:hypothetical protein